MVGIVLAPLVASMKCSSRRNCNLSVDRMIRPPGGCLNEVQLPKELQLSRDLGAADLRQASMKCSSRRNCNTSMNKNHFQTSNASMKCSSRRNCNVTAGQRMGGSAPGPQ